MGHILGTVNQKKQLRISAEIIPGTVQALIFLYNFLLSRAYSQI